MNRPDLRTERLWLRPLAIEHAADLHEAYGDPTCLQHWHHAPTTSVDATREWVARVVDGQDAWAFGLVDGTTALGWVGFVNGLEPGGHAGFGYLLRRDSWGKGFVAEASRAVLSWAFDGEVGIARAELWIERANRRSVRVAEKLGCRLRSDAPTRRHRCATRSRP